MAVCNVGVELTDLVSDEEVQASLAADPANWLREFAPVTTTSQGR